MSRGRRTRKPCALGSTRNFITRVRQPHRRRLRIEPLEDRRLLSITVNTLVDENNGVGVGGLSLREAIGAAAPGETIDFSVTGTINLTHGYIRIDNSLTINGPGANLLTIDASGNDPTPNTNNGDGSNVFYIDDGNSEANNTVSISGLTLTGGDVTSRGGAIIAWENLVVAQSLISGNSGQFGGGGIANVSGTLTDIESTISGNSAPNGGGIDSRFGYLTVTDSMITGNSASFRGGGIYSKCVAVVTGSTISGNSAGTSAGSDDGGGGIDSRYGNLTVTDSTISGNSGGNRGGGISSSRGDAVVIGSTISGNTAPNGGGIFSYDGTVTIVDTTMSGSIATDGGGISQDFVDLTISGSAISGNSAGDRGGGISNRYGNLDVIASTISGNSAQHGGGIYSHGDLSGSLTTNIVNSTISGNTAQGFGGGIYNHGLAMIRHSTITLNESVAGSGGGIASFGDPASTRTEVNDSIIAGNINGDVDSLFGIDNTFQSNGYNLIGTGDATSEFVEPGDQTGVTNPMLGPLADNLGPTFTHALLAGSPAIDMGDPAIVFNPAEFDQRGNPFVRVSDGDEDATARIDIGSYERQTTTLIVDTLADEDDGDYSAGDLSLREAIGLAHGFVGAETITFAASLTGSGPATILLTLGALAISDSLTISSPGASLLTIDASGNDPTPLVNNGDGSRVFTIDDGDFTNVNDKAISISGLTLTGGDVSGLFFFDTGGAILSREDLSIDSCTISGHSAQYGGGISNSGGNLTVTNSTISGNSTTGDGGAILTSGNLLVTHSTLSGNSAARYGGGIFSDTNLTGTQTTTISNSTISGNSAAIRGGGIYNFDGLTVIRHSTITNNTAPAGQGSGIASFGDFATRTEVHSTIIAGNANSNMDFVFGVTNSFQSNGYNLIGAGNATGEFVEPGDQTGVTNPMLGPLADNGGSTMTHALLGGSPAINTGDPAAVAGAGGVPLYDQRDNPFSRVNNGRIDIGAFESNIPSPLVVDTLADENDGDFGTGDLSLRDSPGCRTKADA